MGFSFYMKGKNGVDLLKKYDINYQALGLAPRDCGLDYSDLSELRSLLCDSIDDFGKKHARYIFGKARKLVSGNLTSYNLPLHYMECESCKCKREVPDGFDIEMAERFVNISEDEIYSLCGGY